MKTICRLLRCTCLIERAVGVACLHRVAGGNPRVCLTVGAEAAE